MCFTLHRLEWKQIYGDMEAGEFFRNEMRLDQADVEKRLGKS
jgi:hypothetical protein